MNNMNTTSLITNHADGEGVVSCNARITAEGVKILKKFCYAVGIIAAVGSPLDLASKIKTDETFASHFQQYSEVEVETLEILMKVGKKEKESGALVVLKNYVRCKFV
uniref:Uncharacterized protein n=1 Tax=Chaetoceros debilis TaxID=122233 RepID=A0A7S3QBR6_9STRA